MEGAEIRSFGINIYILLYVYKINIYLYYKIGNQQAPTM